MTRAHEDTGIAGLLPIFRYAQVLLICAGARAQLCELTQGDLDVSINLLRDQVGMPRRV